MEQKQERLLSVTGLQTSFNVPAGEVRSVSGISFSVDKGKILGIVGESGSGKSVTAASLMQILVSPGHIKGGSIVFEGEELVGMSEKELRKKRGDKMAMIFQDPMTALNPVYTIGHQMCEAMLLHKKSRVEALSEKEARALRSENTKLARLEEKRGELKEDDPSFSSSNEAFKVEEELIRKSIAAKKVDYDLAFEAASSTAKLEKEEAHSRYVYEGKKAFFELKNALRGSLSEKVQENARFDNEKRQTLLEKGLRAKQKESLGYASNKNELIKKMLSELKPLEDKRLIASKEETPAILSEEKAIRAQYESLIDGITEKQEQTMKEVRSLRKETVASLRKAHKERLKNLRGQRALILKKAFDSLRLSKEAYKASFTTTKYTAWQKAIEMLSLVGVSEPEKRMKQYPFEFSGGMLQRVMIAMALLSDPDLLIADEPTTALDVTIQAQILDLIKNIQKKLGMGVIIITHDLGVVAQICDEVDVMYAGRIVERGTVDEIFYNPKHEYTKGLMGSIPGQDSTKGEMLHPIEGNPVDVFALPKGCSFGPRCEKCMGICLERYPAERKIDDSHYSSCFMSALEDMKDGKMTKEEFVAYMNEGFAISNGEKARKSNKALPAFRKNAKKQLGQADRREEEK